MGDINEQSASEAGAAADDAADDKAFAEAFDASSKGLAPPPRQEQAPAEKTTPEGQADASAAPAPEPAPAAADPFEGWPPAAKAAMQRYEALEHQMRITTGRVGALQSAYARAAAAAAAEKAAAPAPKVTRSESYTKVAEALPEVLETFNELFEERLKQQQTPAAEPAAAEPADERSVDEIRLDESFPAWRAIGASDEFRNWAAAQADARVIQTTGHMATFMDALVRFKTDQAARSAATQAVQQANALRTQRVDASLTPTRGAPRRPATAYQSDDEAFAAGFRGE